MTAHLPALPRPPGRLPAAPTLIPRLLRIPAGQNRPVSPGAQNTL